MVVLTMTPDELAAIETRDAKMYDPAPGTREYDRRALLAEVRTLTERLADGERCSRMNSQESRALLDLMRTEPEVEAVRVRIDAGEVVEHPMVESVGAVYARLRRALAERDAATWEAKAEAAELIADERSALYGQGVFDYDTVERFGDWCHAWAAQFRAHTETYPDLRAALAGVGQPEPQGTSKPGGNSGDQPELKPCPHWDISNNRCIDCGSDVPWAGQ